MLAVIVDERHGLIKYVKTADSTVSFLTWEKYLQKGHVIELRPNVSLLRDAPSLDSAPIILGDHSLYDFRSIAVQGDWLRLEDTSAREGSDPFRAWVRWRNAEDEILVSFLMQ